MSDSTSILDQVDRQAASSDVLVNELFAAASVATAYGEHRSASSGLVFAYYGARFGGTLIPSGTFACAPSSTTYMVANRSTGAVSFSTSTTNWDDTTSYGRCYQIVSSTTSLTWEDHRFGPGGLIGSGGGSAADAMVFKGAIDCSASPNYPAANAGHVYRVSVGGKIGGASGPAVEAGDTMYCITDGSAAGTHASVGANWVIQQGNIDGAVIGPSASVDGEVSLFNGTSGKLLKRLTGSGYLKVTAGVASVLTAAQLRADLGEKVQVLTDGATISLDASLGSNFRITLGGNRTLANPTNLIDGQVINGRIKQDGTGGRTLGYGSKYRFPGGTPPALSTAANAIDLVSMQYDATDDTILLVVNKAFA